MLRQLKTVQDIKAKNGEIIFKKNFNVKNLFIN